MLLILRKEKRHLRQQRPPQPLQPEIPRKRPVRHASIHHCHRNPRSAHSTSIRGHSSLSIKTNIRTRPAPPIPPPRQNLKSREIKPRPAPSRFGRQILPGLRRRRSTIRSRVMPPPSPRSAVPRQKHLADRDRMYPDHRPRLRNQRQVRRHAPQPLSQPARVRPPSAMRYSQVRRAQHQCGGASEGCTETSKAQTSLTAPCWKLYPLHLGR